MAELGTQIHLDCIVLDCNCSTTISCSIWARLGSRAHALSRWLRGRKCSRAALRPPADPALRTFQSGTGDFWVAAPNRSASIALISRWRSRKTRSSSRLRRSHKVTSSLHLLALQEPHAGATLSSV